MWVYQVLVLEMLQARLLSPHSRGSGQPGVPACQPRTDPGAQRHPRLAPRQGCCRSPCKQGMGGQQPAALHSHSERRRKALGGGGYRRQRGADPRATGRSHTQEGEGSTLWRQAGGSPEPTLPHPSPDARGCLLYVATDDRGGGQDTVTGASIQLKDWDSGFSPRFKHVTLQFHRCLKMPPGHRRTRKQAFRGQHHQERLGRILKYDFKQI